MKVFAPDFGNMIDLPGAGPCPRPVDLDQAKTGFVRLKSLRIYSFPAGVAIDGEAEGDEVLMALVAGTADVTLFQGGEPVGEHALREDGGERMLYMPPHAAYHLVATSDCDVAYARTQPDCDVFPHPRGFAPVDGALHVDDYAVGMTLGIERLGDGAAIDVPEAAERLIHVRTEGGKARIDGEALTDWSTAAIDTPVAVTADRALTLLTVATR